MTSFRFEFVGKKKQKREREKKFKKKSKEKRFFRSTGVFVCVFFLFIQVSNPRKFSTFQSSEQISPIIENKNKKEIKVRW